MLKHCGLIMAIIVGMVALAAPCVWGQEGCVAIQGIGQANLKDRAEQHIPVTFVRGIPVARFNTDIGPMWMVLDSGSNSTYFSEQIIRTRDRICFQGAGCKITADVTNYVPQFARLLTQKHDRTPVIDGLVGEDVLSRFKDMRLDYHRQEVVLVSKGGRRAWTTREEHEIEIRKEELRKWSGN